MKKLKLLLLSVFALANTTLLAQTLTITSPVLTPPYQVTTGTNVTFEWDAFSSPPNAIFTHNAVPSASILASGLPPDPSWTQHTNFTGPVSGKYYITLPITANTWVFGGLSGWIGWSYSNVIPIQVISNYAITASDSMICSTNDSVTFTAPTGSGLTYQWYQNSNIITGATNNTYVATSADSYHCVINSVSATNTITIANYVASYTGSYNSNQITLVSDQSFTSYQWYERTGATKTVISGATNNQYVATVSSTGTYYSFEGTTASNCVVSSPERFVIDTVFNTPSIVLNTTVNSFGKVCKGTPTSLVASGNSGFHQWKRNGINSISGTNSININGAYQNGTWLVDVAVIGWPEISLISNSVVVSIYELITPVVTGANYYDNFCAGDIVPMILTDEGYTYTWYVHDTMNIYNSSHIVSAPTHVYQHTFTTEQYVTIVAQHLGCETKKTIRLKSWANQDIYLSISNYTQQYLCVDSSVSIMIPSYQVSDYQNFQWYKDTNTVWMVISGATSSSYSVTAPGKYRVTAVPVACTTTTITSQVKEIYSYLDRQPSIYAYDTEICEGDTAVLRISGGSNWYAKQWLESDISIGQGGYERDYTGMLTNSATDTQMVVKYSSYRVSAKHNSCPNGLKTKSNILFITPKVHPEIVVITPLMTQNKHVIDWDSTEHVIGCHSQPVDLTLNNLNYTSIDWYSQLYAGDDDYALGTFLSSGDTATENLDAIFITAVVTDSTGCTGQSTPLLLDTWQFLSPAITSYDNNELCNPGDSVLMHLAFPGTWVAYQWYLDGVVIPGATNDSIWGQDTGMYVLNAFPAACPTFEYSSGVGPTVKYLYADILENDSLIYAVPELGYYSYQWFFNGDSIDAPIPNIPWIFPKDSMENGTYTVAISNNNCTKTSSSFIWNSSGVGKISAMTISVYPNPTSGILNIEVNDINDISLISVTDMSGREVQRFNGLNSNKINISSLQSGAYIIRFESKGGLLNFTKILKD